MRCQQLRRRRRYSRHSLHAKRQAKWTNKKCMNDVTRSAVERVTDMVSSVGSSRTDLWDVGGLDAQAVPRSWALTIDDAADHLLAAHFTTNTPARCFVTVLQVISLFRFVILRPLITNIKSLSYGILNTCARRAVSFIIKCQFSCSFSILSI